MSVTKMMTSTSTVTTTTTTMTAYAAAPALAAAAKAQRKVKRKRWKEMMNEGREEKGKNLRFSKKEGLTVIKNREH